MKRIYSLCIMVGLLSACDSKPTRDVQYYLDHPDERAEKLAECHNNTGEKAVTPNCINAGEAERKAMFSGNEMPSIR